MKAVKANLEEKGVDQPTKDMKLELITILIRGEKTRKKETTEEMVLKEDIEENEAVPDTVTEVTIPVKGEVETTEVEILLEEGVKPIGEIAMSLAAEKEETLTEVVIEILTKDEIPLIREEKVMVAEECLEEKAPRETLLKR